jgi:hypothetical protein
MVVNNGIYKLLIAMSYQAGEVSFFPMIHYELSWMRDVDGKH